MHSQITEETERAWELLAEGEYQQVLEQVEPLRTQYEDEKEDEFPSEPKTEETGDPLSDLSDLDPDELPEQPPEQNGDDMPPGLSSKDRPVDYWDALILSMIARLGLEKNAETWDVIEKLLPCSNSEIRNIAVGLARMSEGILIKRMEEMGDHSDSHRSLEQASQELEDQVMSFQGNIKSSADPRDQFLGGFSHILGQGKWDLMRDVIENLEEQEENLDEEEQRLKDLAEHLMELERRCTPEKIQEVKNTDIPQYYKLYMELMEWRGSDLDKLQD